MKRINIVISLDFLDDKFDEKMARPAISAMLTSSQGSVSSWLEDLRQSGKIHDWEVTVGERQ